MRSKSISLPSHILIVGVKGIREGPMQLYRDCVISRYLCALQLCMSVLKGKVILYQVLAYAYGLRYFLKGQTVAAFL